MSILDLIVERGGRISLGRVSWWACLIVALVKVWTVGDVPTALLGLLTTILGYLYGKKWTKPNDPNPGQVAK